MLRVPTMNPTGSACRNSVVLRLPFDRWHTTNNNGVLVAVLALDASVQFLIQYWHMPSTRRLLRDPIYTCYNVGESVRA